MIVSFGQLEALPSFAFQASDLRSRTQAVSLDVSTWILARANFGAHLFGYIL